MGSGSSDNNQIASQGLEKTIRESKQKEKISKTPPFTEDEVARIRRKFDALDVKRSGSISLKDFKVLPEISSHFFRERINYLTEKKLKQDQKQVIDFEYLLQILKLFHPSTLTEQKYDYLFKIYDINEDDIITIEDFKKTVQILYEYQGEHKPKQFEGALMSNLGYVESLAKDIMDEYDKDRTGALDPEEFNNMVDDLDLLFRMNINF